MCVALPARVEWIGDRTGASIPARVVIGDTVTDVDLMLVPEVAVGDHVVVHAGYAISVVSGDSVAETMRLLGEPS